MPRVISEELLAGFIAEAKSYIPTILQRIEIVRVTPTSLDELEEAHRYIHTIKGAASMVGMDNLTKISDQIETALEDIIGHHLDMNEDTAILLSETVKQVDLLLDSASNGHKLDEASLVIEVTQAYCFLRGLPFENLDEMNDASVDSPVVEDEDEETTNGFSLDLPNDDNPMPELIQAFAAEAKEYLDNISTLLSEFKDDTNKCELLPDIAKIVHTLKGGAKMVGFVPLAKVSQKTEDILNQLCDGTIRYTPDLIDLISDLVNALENIAGGWIDEKAIDFAIQELYSHYSNVLEIAAEELPDEVEDTSSQELVDPEVAAIFAEEAAEHLSSIGTLLPAWDKKPERQDFLEEICRSIHTLKGTAGLVGFETITQLAEPMEELLEQLIEGNRTATSEVKEILFASANMLEKLASGKANDTTFKTLLATYETLLSSTPSPSKEEPESAPERVEDESEELDTGLLPEHVEDTEPVDSLADFSDLFDEETDTEPVDSLADFSDLFDEEMATSELFDEPIPLPEFEIDTIPTSIDSIDEEMIQSESSETNTGMFEEPEFVEQSEDCATKQDHDDEIETVDPELAEIFAAEAEDHLRIISTLLPAWDKEPTRKELLQQIRRSVHTLKGAAGMVGFQTITELAHRMEDLLDQLYDEMRSVNPDIMALLFASADTLDDLAGGTVNAETLQALYANYAEILDSTTIVQELIAPKTKPVVEETVSTQESQPVVSEEKHRDTIDIVPLTSDEVEPETNGKATPMPMQSSEVMRVPLERLDELIRLVSELAITRTTFEQRMGNMVHEVEELRASLERLRQVSFDLETKYEVKALGSGLSTLQSMQFVEGPRPIVAHGFDDLEFDRYTEFHRLSRELAETTSDINTVGNELGTLIGEFDGILTRQRRLSTEIQEKLMRTRMVPLATLATRLNRTVRVVSRKQGKLVDLVLEGENVELDKTVLDEMADPLLHLLRNSVDHGIELPEMRRTISKPEHGTIHLRSYHQGNQVVIQISDDGAGLNPQKLRAAIVKKGYVSEADALKLSDDELYSFIFTPGFSTAGKVSEISGRGVGMDIVRTNVLKLKGSISVDSQPGQGITFTIRLPMTLAVTRSLMVRAHNEMFAIPSDAVMQILRLEEDEFEVVGQELVVRVGENVYPTVRLGEVLHLKQSVDETIERWPVLILNAGTQQVALIVEQIIGGREIVIKNLGNHLRKVHGITGATLMGDGSVVLILNPAELAMKPPRPKLRERKDMLREIRRSIYRLKESTGMVGIETVPQFATYLEELFNQLYSGKQHTDMDIIEVWEDINTPEKESPVQRNGTLNIMVVDDSVSVRRVVSNLVKNSGWEPVTAKDGLEALEIIQHTSRLPDLMLLDVEMPRMDGYELTATLRADKMYKDLPIVMVTSRAGEKHRRKALEVGANEYVVKPYQDDILVSIIRNLTA